MIKYSNKKPKNYKQIKADFPFVDWDGGIIITWGDTVYSKYPLSPEKIVHEQVHIEQQAKYGGPDKYYEMYKNDTMFRFKMELEAFKAEAAYITEHVKDRNVAFRMKHKMCLTLSSGLYGYLCTYHEAIDLLK